MTRLLYLCFALAVATASGGPRIEARAARHQQPQPSKPPTGDKEGVQQVAAQVEADKIPVDISVLRDGKQFPDSAVLADPDFRPPIPEPRRVFHVSSEAAAEGDGSEGRPWRDLQAALCRLEAGDQLMVAPGAYTGSFLIGGSCKDGTKEAPIHVFARGAILRGPTSKDYTLAVEKAFWYIEGVQMVLGESTTNAFVVRGAGAHDVTFEHAHLFEGFGSGIVIGPGTANITISNSHIHHFKNAPPNHSYGVEIYPGTRDITLIHNHIHHNFGASVKVVGAEEAKARNMPVDPEAVVENLSIRDCKFHDDKGSAVDVSAARGVRIATNKIYNYRPVQDYKGAAIVIGPGVVGAVVEENHIAEATIGIQVGANEVKEGRPGPVPDEVLIYRNYMENRLTTESIGINVVAGRKVSVFNNMIDHYADAIRLMGGPPQIASASIANNIAIEPRLAFHLSRPEAATFFDHNVFGSTAPSVRVEVGTETRNLSDYLATKAMPNTKMATGVELLDRDLAKVKGVSLVDAGKMLEGITFKGAAPDIGVAEKEN